MTLSGMMQEIEDHLGYMGMRAAITRELLDNNFKIQTAEAIRRVYQKEIEAAQCDPSGHDADLSVHPSW